MINNMMKSVLAFKYAVAFMRVFSLEVNEHIVSLRSFVASLRQKKGMFAAYSLVVMQQKIVKQCIDRFLHNAGLPSYFFLLVHLLIAHKRFELFVEVLEAIEKIVRDKCNQQKLVIYSAQTLSENSIKKIENYMYVMRKKSISQVICIVQPNLIAGIRVESDNFVLECSVRKQLTTLNTMLKREGIVYE